MSYTATCPVMSQADAEKIGKFLAQYEISVGSLAVFQIDVDGQRHRDNALLNTIKETAGEIGAGIVLAPLMVPLIGLFPPIVAIATALNSVNLISLPVLKKAQHETGKRIPRTGNGKEIAYTEVVFDLTNVSDQRRLWSEYLLSAFSAWSGWTALTGLRHPEQLAAGQAYVARYGRLPPPRDARRRDDTFAKPPPAAQNPMSPLMQAQQAARLPQRFGPARKSNGAWSAPRSNRKSTRTSRQTISLMRRMWWRITDEL